MFTEELDDNRTRRQKKLDRERQQPHQTEMFSQRDLAQFGVNAHPLMPISENTKLGLIFEDPRTEEEKERDRQHATEERTFRMFDDTSEPEIPSHLVLRTPGVVDTETLAVVVYQTPCLALVVVDKVCRAAIPYEGRQ